MTDLALDEAASWRELGLSDTAAERLAETQVQTMADLIAWLARHPNGTERIGRALYAELHGFAASAGSAGAIERAAAEGASAAEDAALRAKLAHIPGAADLL
jgi:hypothetical protein